MTFFVNVSMDAAVVLFLSLAALKYLFFKDKDDKSIKLAAVGGLLILISGLIPSITLSNLLSIPANSFVPLVGAVYTIGFALVLIGGIKLVLVLLKKAFN